MSALVVAFPNSRLLVRRFTVPGSLNKPCECRANPCGHRHRPARFTIDKDVHEVTRRGRKRFSLFEYGKFVADTRISQLADA